MTWPPLLFELLECCVNQGASDLHLAANLPPRLRIQGLLEPIPGQPVLSADDLRTLAAPLLGEDQQQWQERGDQDSALTTPNGARFRCNVFRRGGQVGIALRRLEDRFRSLAELGLPESIGELCDLHHGLVLVAGPTGSGKSTTLATLIDRINRNQPVHIVTIEDPIEYVHASRRAMVNQRQIGGDCRDFNTALVAALRQDPDVILVGEIRDQNTIRTAIAASETGHLVFATVHAGDCVGAIERLIAVFPADEQHAVRRQLALVLRAIISQHLVPADGPAGLQAAGNDGLRRRRRVVVAEVLRMNAAIANLISTAKPAQIPSAMELGTADGMQTTEQSLAQLVLADLLSESCATSMARDAGVLREQLTMLRRKLGRR
jgi:twitching motility protein PilT